MALELKPNWLDNLHIATPCRADWERMEWEDEEGRVRFCRTCEKNVYNISLMSRAEALDLIRAKEGQLCMRLAKRKDGTLITNDCPVGQSKRQTKRRFAVIAGAFLLGIVPSPFSNSLAYAGAWFLRRVPGMEGIANVVGSQPGQTLVNRSVDWWVNRTAPPDELVPTATMGIPALPIVPQPTVAPPAPPQSQ
jgi:hypothetical protein